MKNRYVLLADLAVFTIAVFGAFGLRFDWFGRLGDEPSVSLH